MFLTALTAALSFSAIGVPTSQATFPGQDGRIFFVSDRDGNDEIYSMNSDGTDQRRLTSTNTDEAEPSVSPNGRWVVFQSSAEGPFSERIEIMRSNGTSREVLTGGAGAQSLEPSFTSNGRGVLFVGISQTWAREILLLDLASRALSQVTEDGVTPQVAPAHPGMLPDGSRIIYQGQDGVAGDQRIFSIPTGDASSPQMISPATSLSDERPGASPDSRSVLYTSYGPTNTSLVRTNLATPATFDLLTISSPSALWTGVFSPSGASVAYETYTDGDTYPYQVHVKEADVAGGGPVITGPGSSNRTPSWASRTLTAHFRAARKPARQTRSRTAKFRFQAVTRGTKLTCKLDRKPARPCPVGRTVTFRGLKRGGHRLRVTPYLVDQTAGALGQASRVDGRSVNYRWKVR